MFFLAQSPDPSTQPIQIFGTRLVGFTPENGRKLLFTLGFLIAVVLIHWLLHALAKLVTKSIAPSAWSSGSDRRSTCCLR